MEQSHGEDHWLVCGGGGGKTFRITSTRTATGFAERNCPLQRCMVTGESTTEPLLIFARHRRGMRVPVEVTVAPISNHSGQMIGGIEAFRESTLATEDQLEAKEIQEMSVKCELPADERVTFEICYQPREIVGGDFFRIDALDRDEYAVLVADMRGHGIAAALYTMCLRSLWNEHHAELRAPVQFMQWINEQLHAIVRDSGYFGTGKKFS